MYCITLKQKTFVRKFDSGIIQLNWKKSYTFITHIRSKHLAFVLPHIYVSVLKSVTVFRGLHYSANIIRFLWFLLPAWQGFQVLKVPACIFLILPHVIDHVGDHHGEPAKHGD